MEEKRMHTEFWPGNLSEKLHFKHGEATGRITLRWISDRQTVRLGGG
jgi:hypothetical protein